MEDREWSGVANNGDEEGGSGESRLRGTEVLRSREGGEGRGKENKREPMERMGIEGQKKRGREGRGKARKGGKVRKEKMEFEVNAFAITRAVKADGGGS